MTMMTMICYSQVSLSLDLSTRHGCRITLIYTRNYLVTRYSDNVRLCPADMYM